MMLDINTAIDVGTLLRQLEKFGIIDSTKHRIAAVELMGINIEVERIDEKPILSIVANYEILVERNNKQNYYKVRITNRRSISRGILNSYTSDTVEIYE